MTAANGIKEYVEHYATDDMQSIGVVLVNRTPSWLVPCASNKGNAGIQLRAYNGTHMGITAFENGPHRGRRVMFEISADAARELRKFLDTNFPDKE